MLDPSHWSKKYSISSSRREYNSPSDSGMKSMIGISTTTYLAICCGTSEVRQSDIKTTDTEPKVSRRPD